MFMITILLVLLFIFNSEDITTWTYKELNITLFEDSNITSFLFVSSFDLHLITYSNNYKNYIYIIEDNYIYNISMLLSPFAVNLNNKIYIFFSESDNNLYYNSIENDNLNMISYEGLNISGLKGMEFYNSNIAFISLLGTNNILYYIYNNNKLELRKSFNFDYKIISFYGNSSTTNIGTAYLYSYINETTTFYAEYKFSNGKFNEISNIIIKDTKILNITEISKALDNDYSLLVFTYNKNDVNFYFYYYDYETENAELKSSGNKYNFWPFRGAEIKKVFFLKNTEYLYYLIIKNNIYNAGVLDMANNLVIFNLKEDYIEYISVRNYYLVYGINGTIYFVCPFNSNNPDSCSPTLDNNLYIKISKDYVNTYSTRSCTYSEYKIGRNCFKNLPLGYKYTYYYYSYYVYKCEIFDIDLMECVDSCDENKIFDSINGMCYSCSYFKQYKYSEINECVEDCSIYGLYSNTTDYTCQNCSLAGYYIENNICKSKCSPFYVIDEINKICINCSTDTEDTPFYQDNKCVKECDSNAKIDRINKICFKCPTKTYYQYGACVTECNKYYMKDSINSTCYNCTLKYGNNYYFFNNTCTSICPNNTFKNESTKICYTCEESNTENIFYENGKCVKDCSPFYFKDETNKICQKCNEINVNLYFQDNLCVEECKEYYFIDNVSMICLNCSEYNNTLFQENKCVKNCSKGYVKISSSISACAKCYDLNRTFEFNGNCVEACPYNSMFDYNDKFCYLCDEGLFYDLKKQECINQCEDYNEIDYTNFTCKDCLSFGLIYNNITQKCVENCPNGTFLINNICERCDIYDEINKKCLENCLDGEYSYYIENKNKSFCFDCFCGYGNCIPYYYYSYNDNEDYLNDGKLYHCDCNNNIKNDNELIFGKYCQYKILNKNLKRYDKIYIKPLQDSVYINKINIFTFEFSDEKDIDSFNSLRKLLTNHEENKKRRIKYKFKWILNEEKNTEQNDLYFILEPGLLNNANDNKIRFTISNVNDNNIISEKELYIKTESININDFNIQLKNYSLIYYPMIRNFCPKILVTEKSNNNYLLNYKYITRDGEEFSLIEDIKNNYKYNEMLIPSSKKIKIEIKSDYNDIVYKEFDIYFKNIDNYNNTLSKILLSLENSNNSSELKRNINELKNFFDCCETFELSEEENNIYSLLEMLEEFLTLSLINENSINNNNSLFASNKLIESNYYISLINQISLFIYNLDSNLNNTNNETKIKIYENISKIIINSLKNNEINMLFEETIISLLRTIDNLLNIWNKINNNILDYSELFELINILKKIISKNIISNTKVKFKGKNYNVNLIKPSYYSEEISINKEKDDSTEDTNYNNENVLYEFYNYKFEYTFNIYNKMKCTKEAIFCIDAKNYDYLYDQLTYLQNLKITNLTISLAKFNNKNVFNFKWNKILNMNNNDNLPIQIVDYSYILDFIYNNKIIDNYNNFRYNLTFDFPEKFKSNISDIACIAVNSLYNDNNNIQISKNENCISFFDLDNKKIICDCNINGEILVLLDKNLAELSKKNQFSKKQKITNSLSGGIVLSSLALIAIYSIILFHFDFNEDDFSKKMEYININKQVQLQYKSFRSLKDSSLSKFSLYITYYKYSFFNIFSTYNFDHPRYIRYIIEIIKILLNLLLSIYPYYFKEFKLKNDFINQRNINNKYKKNLSYELRESFYSFINSLIASIIIWFIAQIFIKILEFKKIQKEVWKPKNKLLLNYIYENIKKYPNFNRKLKKTKNAIFAYIKICGKKILSKKGKDQYYLYLEQKNSTNQKIDVANLNYNNNINNFKKTKTELALIQDIDRDSLKDKLLDEKEINISLSKNSINKIFERDSINLGKRVNLEIIRATTFSLFSKPPKSKNYISVNHIHKLEIIKYKYISNKEKIGDGQKKSYVGSNKIKYIGLELKSLNNFTYLSSSKINKKNPLIDTKSLLSMTKFITIMLFILLFIIDIFIIIVFNKIYKEYENYIILIWLIPVLIQITIFNFIINYLFSFISSYFLYYHYEKRKKSNCISFIFNLLVEKYMIYFYKIRMLINKYDYQYAHI